jgi:hypothetical protein
MHDEIRVILDQRRGGELSADDGSRFRDDAGV